MVCGVFDPIFVSLERVDHVKCEMPDKIVLFHVVSERGGQNDPQKGSICVVFVIGGLWVDVVGRVDVVCGQDLLE